MGDRDHKGSTARVYVGGLNETIKKEDLEGEFEKYGKLNSVWVAFNPPGFAFIEFDEMTDAESACDSLNGTDMFGSKLIVEIARGRSRRGGFRGGRGGGGYRGGGGFRGRPSFDRYGGPPRRNSGGPGGDRFGGRDQGRRSDGFRGRSDSYGGGRGGGGPRRFDDNPRFRSRSPAGGGGPRR
ncbi:RNA-binding protein Rsf1 [Harmonia axyridis]|uniref:RNA-binding protein Rsf1 n=1 Tax=Harmonia axyridis TaxID=115357 RepID=UPI001E278224|nr:RNA-binding protein Rsf1 [Harmonia axyridis]